MRRSNPRGRRGDLKCYRTVVVGAVAGGWNNRCRVRTPAAGSWGRLGRARLSQGRQFLPHAREFRLGGFGALALGLGALLLGFGALLLGFGPLLLGFGPLLLGFGALALGLG